MTTVFRYETRMLSTTTSNLNELWRLFESESYVCVVNNSLAYPPARLDTRSYRAMR